MASPDFIHLRVHSSYSLTQSTLQAKALAKWAGKEGYPALALTDKGNLFGALEFAVLAGDAGVQPIHGCVLKTKSLLGPASALVEDDELLLLAQNQQGFENLMDLVSRGFLEANGGDPVLALSTLEGRTGGLIALTGALESSLGRALLAGQEAAAAQHLDWLQTQFDGRLYIELQRHGLTDQQALEPKLFDTAYERGLPLVATNAAHFLDASQFKAHEALLCIGQTTTIHDENRKTLTPHHYLKSPQEMARLFSDVPEALANTAVIAQRCAYAPPKRDPILPRMGDDGEAEKALLESQVREGFEAQWEHIQSTWPEEEDRTALRQTYEERLEFELGVITSMGFSGYFLIVADFIAWAKDQGIPVGPGRGSGAASIVAYALRITTLDPIPYGLLFERFLNPERISMPDFDIDFCQDRREEVIAYVRDKYGADRVAQIITYGSLKARAALRDAGRVLALPFGQVDRLCKMVPNNPANPSTLAEAIESEVQLRQEIKEHGEVRHLFDIAQQIEGLHRSAGTHAAGVVIADRPITQLVPLYQDPRSDMPATQFDMKWVEQAGLVKFDFLGLKTLSILRQIERFAAARGKSVDFETIPLDDAGVYAAICTCKTVGVFQLESTGMQAVIADLQPDRFTDIIALVALYRPGPMENIPSFVARKHGREEIAYLHPGLEEVVSETYGIMIYQEQVLKAAQVLAGYSLGSADFLRKAMGKKIKSEMDAQRKTFVDGAAEHSDIKADLANAIFDQIASFAGYGFNKAHSACYALVAYQTAYARHYFPAEFFAANMNYEMASTDKLAIFKDDLQAANLTLATPDVNASDALFKVEDDETIRYGLAAIKGVGQVAMEQMVAEREAGGAFKDLRDFAVRAAPFLNKKQLEQLILSGALDGLHANRAEAYYALEHILSFGQAEAAERNSAQENLFLGGSSGVDMPLEIPAAPDWETEERLNRELEALGFFLSDHPLSHRMAELEKLNIFTIASLMNPETRPKGMAKIAGVISGRQERRSAKGSKFAFLALSDATGAAEVVIFSDLLLATRDFLEAGQAVQVDVNLEDQGEQGVRLTAQAIRPLEEVVSQKLKVMTVFANAPGQIELIRDVLEHAPPGSGRVQLVCDLPAGRSVTLRLGQSYRVDKSLASALGTIEGITVARDGQGVRQREEQEFSPYADTMVDDQRASG